MFNNNNKTPLMIISTPLTIMVTSAKKAILDYYLYYFITAVSHYICYYILTRKLYKTKEIVSMSIIIIASINKIVSINKIITIN